MLIEMEANFWNHVQNGTPPSLDGSNASAKFLAERFPSSTPKSHITLLETAADLLAQYDEACEELEKPVETVVTTSDVPLAPADSGCLALTSNALDIIRANLKSQPLTLDLFDLVKSPSGGSTVFSVPGLSGDEPEKELTGIILDFTTPRAYWDTPDPVESTPPVCMSQNSIISHDGKACAHCSYNDFGSKDCESNAKACKESALLFLLRPKDCSHKQGTSRWYGRFEKSGAQSIGRTRGGWNTKLQMVAASEDIIF